MKPECVKPGALLIGDGVTSLSALRALMPVCDVVAVIRADADPETDPVRALAARNGIAVRPIADLRGLAAFIAASRPDAVVISTFNRILPPETLALTRFINVHYSPLPEYRGRATVNWAIINGEREAAISIHWIEPRLDSGNILFQERIPIGDADTAQSLYDRLNGIQERELGAAVLRAVSGDAGVEQDHRRATYCCARTPDDGEIDWRKSTAEIDRLIRALSSPQLQGAFTYLDGGRLVIADAAPGSDEPPFAGRIPGRVINRSPEAGWVDVLTGDGVLRISKVVEPSGRSFSAAALISSTRLSLGLSRQALLRRVESLEERIARFESDRTPHDAVSRMADLT